MEFDNEYNDVSDEHETSFKYHPDKRKPSGEVYDYETGNNI